MKKILSNEQGLRIMWFVAFLLVPNAIIYSIGILINSAKLENFGTGGMIAIGLFALFIMFKTEKSKKPWEDRKTL